MNKICKQYIADIKSIFPIMGKEERDYIGKLAITVNEFCETENVTSKNILYKKFGTPTDVANTYYTGTDIERLLKRMRISRYIKTTATGLLLILLLIMIIFALVYASDSYHTQELFDEMDAIFEDFRQGKRTYYLY